MSKRHAMRNQWLCYLKKGISRSLPMDRISLQMGDSGRKAKIKYLRPYIDRHWRKGLLGTGLVLLTAVFCFPQPLIMRYVVDDVILVRKLGLLAGAVLLLAGISLAGKLTGLLQEFYFTRLEQDVTLDIQQDLLDRTLHFPKSFFDETHTGYLMSRLSNDVQGLRWFFSSTIVHVISNGFRFLGGIGLLFYLEWRLTIGVLVIIPGIVFCMQYFSKRIRILSHHNMEEQAAISNDLQESLSSVSLIKAFSSEEHYVGRFIARLKGAFQISLEQSAVSALANIAVDSMPGMARITVLALGAFWIIKGEWSLGSLIAFQAYLGYVFGPAQFLATANLQLQNAMASLERVSALFEVVPEERKVTGRDMKRIKGELAFREVSFSYEGKGPVLKGVSFNLCPGEHMAIVGPSGVGKTTLINLILGFYQPDSGEICFDGLPASAYDIGSLRRRIGYVSQNTLLLSGTIMENIRIGNPKAGREEILLAAQWANIHDFIMNLPEGYESRIGEKGVNLSEGQRQRIAIARALVKNPDILILDEPTSALDNRLERDMFDSILSVMKGKTLLMVTLHMPAIEKAEKVLLMTETGPVVIGTHQRLLETNAYYRSLLNAPTASVKPEPSLICP